jgi:CubicO group peptidase (beta-lactamase class C family)
MPHILQPYVAQGLIAGAVTLVATRDKILSLEATGFADLAARKPMETDAVFWIASMTKPMTATALMMLVDEGGLGLDDAVEKYIPEFAGQMVIAERDEDHVLLKKPRHPITVREILCHTAGLSFDSPIEKPTYDRFSLEDGVRAYAATNLLFQPGTQFNYSNAGTNTAGRLIEILSGMPYETFMDERLFMPLGMTDTTFWPNEKQLGRLAKIYRANADKTGLEETTLTQLRYPFNDRARKPMPAGGLFSTAADCAKFCQMLLNGGTVAGRLYVSEAAIREMGRKQTGDLVEKSYGLCMDVNGPKFGHGGAYKTNMMIDPQLGVITVFLIHHSHEWPNEAGAKILPAFWAAAEKMV